MKRLVAISVALLLAAGQAQAEPTYKGQRDLDTLVSFFTGNWDPRPGEPPVRFRVSEFWKGSPVRWLYVEWVRTDDDLRPTRQLVFRIAEDGREGMTTTVHRLPGDAARFAGEWRKAKPFEALQPRDLAELANCRLKTQRLATAHFTLTTEGNKCPSDGPDAPFMGYEFSLLSSELELLEQPRDAAGKVPPSRLKPYKFARMSREAR
jgi:hypothetical protein